MINSCVPDITPESSGLSHLQQTIGPKGNAASMIPFFMAAIEMPSFDERDASLLLD